MNFKVGIIGSGVAGMTLAIYLKRAGIDFVLIEARRPGGQINFAPLVENFPSYEKISGRELSQKIYNQVQALNVNYLNDEVVSIDKDKKKYKLKMKKNDDIIVDTVFIATGKKIKKLDIPNVNDFVGVGLSYCATCDGMFFADKDVLVVGDTNKALEESLYLAGICRKVIILCKNDKIQADDFYRKKVESKENIEIIYNAILKNLVKDEVLKEAIIVRDGKEEILSISGCFAYVGYLPNTELFKHLVKLDGDNYIIVDENMCTSEDNVYAIGDVNNRKIFQLLTAMNDAVVAANDYLK